VSRLQEPAVDDLEIFAAAVAHELRTPLAALSGEVDVALRRDRSAAAYRDALARIAASVAELVELTGDLMFLGQPGDAERLPATTARLDRVVARVAERYAAHAEMALTVDPVAPTIVAGDEALLARAVTLVVEHAVKHRRGGAPLRLHAASAAEDPTMPFGRIDLIVDAPADAFWPQTWQCLVATRSEERGGAARLNAGPLRLCTADRIVTRCGGSLHAASADGAGGIHIVLRCAEPA
jgi:signal transduction histidine kinase